MEINFRFDIGVLKIGLKLSIFLSNLRTTLCVFHQRPRIFFENWKTDFDISTYASSLEKRNWNFFNLFGLWHDSETYWNFQTLFFSFLSTSRFFFLLYVIACALLTYSMIFTNNIATEVQGYSTISYHTRSEFARKLENAKIKREYKRSNRFQAAKIRF